MGRGRGRNGRTRAAVGGAALCLVTIGGGLPTRAGAAPTVRTCPAPTVVDAPEWDIEGTPPGVPNVRMDQVDAPPATSSSVLDMDHDGTADASSNPTATSVQIVRGDGTLTITGFPTGTAVAYAIGGHDLDGDDHTELVVIQSSGLGSGRTSATYLFPGTTPTGTFAWKDIGTNYFGNFVGDITGDGHDDIHFGLNLFGVILSSGYIAGVDALLPSDDGAVAPSVDIIGGRYQLDNDPIADQVHTGSVDGSKPAYVEFSSGPDVPLPGVTGKGVNAYLAGSSPILQMAGPKGSRVISACAEAWMRSMTQLLFGRAPSPADYPTFGPLDDPTKAQRLVRMQAMVRSQSARGVLVDRSFQQYLERAADPSGRSYWVAALRSGRRTPEQMAATLLSSREVLTKTSGTPESFIQLVFPRVMGRAPDPGGLSYWSNQVSKFGANRAASRLLASPEARRRLIRSFTDSQLVLGGGFGVNPYHQADGLKLLDTKGYDAFLADLLSQDDVYLKGQRVNQTKPA